MVTPLNLNLNPEYLQKVLERLWSAQPQKISENRSAQPQSELAIEVRLYFFSLSLSLSLIRFLVQTTGSPLPCVTRCYK